MFAGIASGSMGTRTAAPTAPDGGGAWAAGSGDGRAPVLAAALIVSAFDSGGPAEWRGAIVPSALRECASQVPAETTTTATTRPTAASRAHDPLVGEVGNTETPDSSGVETSRPVRRRVRLSGRIASDTVVSRARFNADLQGAQRRSPGMQGWRHIAHFIERWSRRVACMDARTAGSGRRCRAL
jgi:hypothetical protein